MPKRMGNNVAEALPDRVILNAMEGFGKTTFAALCRDPAILMARGEDGYATLRRHNLVPQCDAVSADTWLETLDIIRNLPRCYGTLALDAMGGFERLCHEYVCETKFKGDWSEAGFLSYNKGYDRAVADWQILLQELDKVRRRGTNILILSHARVRPVPGTIQAVEYKRWGGDCHDKTWEVTARWADAILFGHFVTKLVNAKVDSRTGVTKGVGVGEGERVVCTAQRDSYIAKNRMGMPAEIEIPADTQGMYAAIAGPLGWAKPPQTDAIDEPPAL